MEGPCRATPAKPASLNIISTIATRLQMFVNQIPTLIVVFHMRLITILTLAAICHTLPNIFTTFITRLQIFVNEFSTVIFGFHVLLNKIATLITLLQMFVNEFPTPVTVFHMLLNIILILKYSLADACKPNSDTLLLYFICV